MNPLDKAAGRRVALALLALGLWLGAGPILAQAPGFPELDEQFSPLRERFNADRGKVRLVLLLDPT